MKNKSGLELAPSHISGYKTSSENSFISNVWWPSLMMQYKVVFKLFQKLHLLIYASQFMRSYVLPLLFAHLSLEKAKRKEKITKIWISREKKIFLDKTKSIFHSFLSATIWLKIKNSRHKNVVGCWMFAGKDIDADINTVF